MIDLFTGAPRHAGDRLAAEVVARIAAVPPKVRPYEWAATHRKLAEGTGPNDNWDPSLTPYTCMVMDFVDHPEVEAIVMPWSTQVGKSEVGINATLYWASELGQAVGYVLPGIERVRKECKKRIRPAVRMCGPLADQMTGRDEDESSQLLSFMGGASISFYSSGAVTAMRGESKPKWAFDEVDAPGFDMSAVEESSERQKAWSRAEMCKVYMSSPGDEGTGTDLLASECGSVFRYHVPCPHCGTYQTLVFDRGEYGLKWTKSESHSDRVDTARESARYVCKCAACRASDSKGRIENHHKPWMLMMGVWVQDGEAIDSDGSVLQTRTMSRAEQWENSLARRTYDEMRETDGEVCQLATKLGVRVIDGPGLSSRVVFCLSSLYSPFAGATFGMMAAQFVKAGKMTKKFCTDWLGEAWRRPGNRIEPSALIETMPEVGDELYYELGSVPPWVLALTMAADLQRDRAIVTVRGWGKCGQMSCLVWAGEIDTKLGNNLVELDAMIGWRFPVWGKPSADPMRIQIFTADSGDGERVDEVYKWVLRHEKPLRKQSRIIRSLKGSSSKTMASMAKQKRIENVVRQGKKMTLSRSVPHLEINTNMAKHALYKTLGLGLDGEVSLDSITETSRTFVWPGKWDTQNTDAQLSGATRRVPYEMYFSQLTGEEYRLIESRTAVARREWRVIPGRENHFMDTEVYQIAQADAYGIDKLRDRSQQPTTSRDGSRGGQIKPRLPADPAAVLREG